MGVWYELRTELARQKGAVVGDMSILAVSICRPSSVAQSKGIYYSKGAS